MNYLLGVLPEDAPSKVLRHDVRIVIACRNLLGFDKASGNEFPDVVIPKVDVL